MFLVTEWEMFYTKSKNDDDLVDQISIDVRNKRYILDIDVSDLATDGYDDADNAINSVYVSRDVFDILVSGMKQKNFTEYVGNV